MEREPITLNGVHLPDGSVGLPLTSAQQRARLLRPISRLFKDPEWRETRVALVVALALAGMVAAGNATIQDPGVPAAPKPVLDNPPMPEAAPLVPTFQAQQGPVRVKPRRLGR